MLRQRSAQISLALVCFLLGIMLVVQFRTHTRIIDRTLTLPANEQRTAIASLYDANQKLRQEVDDLRAQLLGYEGSLGKSELDSMVADINRLRAVNGTSEVSGPGVEVTIEGQLRTDGSIAPEDAGDLVNELRDAGAEAIAVNGVRVTVNTYFARADGGLTVGGDRVIKVPYVFQAIGQPEALESTLNRPAGMISWLKGKYPGAGITIYRKTALVLPKGDHNVAFKLAKPVK